MINLLIWFACVAIVGQMPIFFRLLILNFEEALGSGEVLIVVTIIAGAAVERAAVRLRASSREEKRAELRRAQQNVLWACLIVSVTLMLVSIGWYGFLVGNHETSSRVIQISSVFLVVAVMLGSTTVLHDDR